MLLEHLKSQNIQNFEQIKQMSAAKRHYTSLHFTTSTLWPLLEEQLKYLNPTTPMDSSMSEADSIVSSSGSSSVTPVLKSLSTTPTSSSSSLPPPRLKDRTSSQEKYERHSKKNLKTSVEEDALVYGSYEWILRQAMTSPTEKSPYDHPKSPKDSKPSKSQSTKGSQSSLSGERGFPVPSSPKSEPSTAVRPQKSEEKMKKDKPKEKAETKSPNSKPRSEKKPMDMERETSSKESTTLKKHDSSSGTSSPAASRLSEKSASPRLKGSHSSTKEEESSSTNEDDQEIFHLEKKSSKSKDGESSRKSGKSKSEKTQRKQHTNRHEGSTKSPVRSASSAPEPAYGSFEWLMAQEKQQQKVSKDSTNKKAALEDS